MKHVAYAMTLGLGLIMGSQAHAAMVSGTIDSGFSCEQVIPSNCPTRSVDLDLGANAIPDGHILSEATLSISLSGDFGESNSPGEKPNENDVEENFTFTIDGLSSLGDINIGTMLDNDPNNDPFNFGGKAGDGSDSGLQDTLQTGKWMLTGSALDGLAALMSDNQLTLEFSFGSAMHWLRPEGFNVTLDWSTVETTPVPLPGAVWLMGSALLGLVGIKRKKSKA